MLKFLRVGGANYVLSIVFLFISCYFADTTCDSMTLKDLCEVIWYLGLGLFNFIIAMVFTFVEIIRTVKEEIWAIKDNK